MTKSASTALAAPKKQKPRRMTAATNGAGKGGDAQVFSFGDPESVLDRSELFQYFEIWQNGRWYEPPMPLGKLAQTFNMSPYHRSAVALKVNLMLAQLLPSRWLSAEVFERFALDFVQMGNGYLEWVPNLGGRLAMMSHLPALHMRAGVKADRFWFVNGVMGQEIEYDAGTVFQLQQPDVAQEIYGLPEWLSALQSGLLSENATLFRRRYYLNGAHAGFVFYINETLADQKTVDMLSEKIGQAKGVGNFKNLLVYLPGGKEKGVQIMPIADVTAKDEFQGVKNISRDDMLAAHRTPPQIIGIIPQNNGGFGKVSEARDAFYEMEIVPMLRRMLRVNDWARVPLLAFRDYVCADGTRIQQDGTKVPAGAR
jgi:PBSX family phage portal protein